MRIAFILLTIFFISIVSCKPAYREPDAPAYHNPTVQGFTDAIARDTEDANLFFQRSQALIRVNEPDLARKDLLKAIRLDSLNPGYIQALGRIALQQNHPEEAVAAFQKSLKIIPGEARVRLLLSRAYLLRNDTFAARQEVTKVLRAAPGFPGATYVLAQIEATKGDTATAIHILEKYLAGNPGDYQAAQQLGDWLSQTNDPRAVARYRQAFTLDTSNVKPIGDIGNFYERRGKINEAKAAYYECVLRDPDYTDALVATGKILYCQDSVLKALRQFNLAIKTRPNSAEAYFQKGLCLEQLHQKDSARQAFGQALVFRPDYQQAKAGFERTK